MPQHKPVTSLQLLTLRTVAHALRKLCCNRSVTMKRFEPVIEYVQMLLPPQIQAAVCHNLLQESSKLVFPELLNNKYIYICTRLHAEYVWIIDSRNIVPVVDRMDGRNVRTLKMTGRNMQLDPDLETAPYNYQKVKKLEPLYRFIQTLSGLTVLKCSQMCNNYMLELVSQNCPHLEELRVEMCSNVDDEGVFHIAGHMPTHDTYLQIQNGVRIRSTSVCTKLKKVSLAYTLACTASAVVLLHFCPNIEELVVTPYVNIGDVFTTLHGTNPDRYENVKSRYALKTLSSYMEQDENALSLIVRTCPNLEDVTLRCNGVERKDRNLLANILGLNLSKLKVMSCSMPALLWYLEQKGTGLTELFIEHLITAPSSLTFTRTHLQQVIATCPNLKHFTLKLYNNPIQPNVSYSSFGSSLLYFTSLSHLTLEGTSVTSEDLSVLVGKCHNLRELHILIHNLDILDDHVLSDLLASGSLRGLHTLYLDRPMLTLAGLRRLFEECPELHTVGPLSSWAISKKDREELAREIRAKNWDLNIESPEMMQLFIL
ncbi:uncharacterized protein LOC134764098 isoform X1 [Penaeus indicus]|uniref:uncharacterized protein LOC134764098 isoform X1 n=1 Tax=Penaeus indicus TaxID=29960 RepID=UPI00300C6A18